MLTTARPSCFILIFRRLLELLALFVMFRSHFYCYMLYDCLLEQINDEGGVNDSL